jgi:hypothetical protein
MLLGTKNQRWEASEKYFSRIIDGFGTPIDPGIIDVVVALNMVGVNTEASCEGHLGHGNAHPWIRIGAPGVDDLEEELRHARLKVHRRIFNWNRDKAWAKHNEIEARLKPLHMQEWDKVISLLEDFYKHRFVDLDRRLIISDPLMSGQFFLQSQGGARQDSRDDREKAERLKEYQCEMQAFASFLKERFMAEGTT